MIISICGDSVTDSDRLVWLHHGAVRGWSNTGGRQGEESLGSQDQGSQDWEDDGPGPATPGSDLCGDEAGGRGGGESLRQILPTAS